MKGARFFGWSLPELTTIIPKLLPSQVCVIRRESRPFSILQITRIEARLSHGLPITMRPRRFDFCEAGKTTFEIDERPAISDAQRRNIKLRALRIQLAVGWNSRSE